ncbi:MAG: FAD-dependent oxidoreductase [Gammaproteobacteria bacterium]|nr:FAD-dependent oxidoreductase [Gammaproteobacteria bacterium]TVQ47921.1 MAG: FAD-dependent oxidoreductase [Gammaproteobacteria bacterium]
MKVAVIGTGISGLAAARQLAALGCELVVFEALPRVGGHTHTHSVAVAGREYRVDTGFIVFNDRTYPEFRKLLQTLQVASRDAPMSFSVRCEDTGLEYAGTSLDSLFAQRRNLLSPRFLGMLGDILRFNRSAPRDLAAGRAEGGLGDYLAAKGFGERFIRHYIVPMGAAIWSTDPARMLAFPAAFFIRFFLNHGLLTLDDRPQWQVVAGGSSSYIEPLVRPFADSIRRACPVRQVRRLGDAVEIHSDAAGWERFDAAFLACHADEALAMLDAPTPLEHEVLGALPYQRNEAILHTDSRVMPLRRRAWAAWNYHVVDPGQPVCLSYNMNILQGIEAPVQFCVTLNNPEAMAAESVIARMDYAHPVFTPASVNAQARHGELHAGGRVFFCGAYWGYGFHEDGLRSAQRAVNDFEHRFGYAQRDLPRSA